MSDRVRRLLADGINRARDRRRSFRRKCEAVMDRQTAVSIIMLAPGAKIIEKGPVPLLAPGVTFKPGVLAAWTIVFGVGVLVGVYWQRLAAAADSAGETVEEVVDPDG